MMIQIQEPKSLWEIVHKDWVTTLPPGGDRSYNACLVLVNRYSKTPMFLPCCKDYTAMDTAMMIWNKVISHTGLFQIIIIDRDPKFCQHYGQLSIPFLGQSYHSQQCSILKLMV
ncbi:hypothetical protein O181_069595 [Austropuccinia psidii MF-1]|uniref:Integrase catalytic domain-containing protein n=1 Tax=Austropuccinia psidii MF-1 TaxID=1389203 RepID=A0A9Q3F388_9BASI|nr:hypothetical protein [Austropuccinia psidii MF-1]